MGGSKKGVRGVLITQGLGGRGVYLREAIS